MKQIRKRLTYANVMSSLAVFLILGGATALAAGQLGKNSVGTKQLKKGAVTALKLKDGAVTATKIKDGSVTGAKVDLGSLGTVPNANHANNANNANNATNASTASNAEKLGGLAASAFQSRIHWAQVAANGTIVRQSGGATSAGSGGIYEIDFGTDVENSAISAVIIDNGTLAGSIVTMSCADSGKAGFGSCLNPSPNVVKVATGDVGSASVSAQAFYVTVVG